MPAIELPNLVTVRLSLAEALVLFVPGMAALRALRLPASGWSGAGLALGLSVAFWPLLMMACRAAGLMLTPGRLAFLSLTLLVLALVGQRPKRLARWSVWQPDAAAVALAIVLAVAVGLRVLHVQGIVVPPWVDGYHHSLVVQLFLEQGGLPTSWQPYLPVERFYYHFGFHSLAAVVAWLAGANAAQATLWTGQALNALVALAMFPLLRRCTLHAAASVLGMAVPVALYYFPAYFAAWGRYTQLAGLCVLPAAWLLLDDLLQAPPPGTNPTAVSRRRLIVASGLLTAGLFLVHVRVFVFYLIGWPIVVTANLRRPGGRHSRLVALVAATGLATLVVIPWVASALVPAILDRAAISSRWYESSPIATRVPAWLFTIGLNRPLLLLGTAGLVLGLIARRGAAWAAALYVAIAVLVVESHRWGLPPNDFLSPFALAISAFALVALAVAVGGDVLLTALVARCPTGARFAPAIMAALAVLASLLGARQLRQVVTPATILVEPADVEAASWLRQNTPRGACFVVTTGPWQLGTFRGLDAGYWLPLLARRASTIPASFYNDGEVAYALTVNRVAEVLARGDRITDEQLLAVMAESGARYVYVGPASQSKDAALSASRLEVVRELERIYDRGGVSVFRLTTAPQTAQRGEAAHWLCRPLE